MSGLHTDYSVKNYLYSKNRLDPIGFYKTILVLKILRMKLSDSDQLNYIF